MNNDLISREALKKALKSNCKPELCHDYNTSWCERCCRYNDFEDLIDNAQAVPQVTVFTETADEKAVADLKAELKNVIEARPQGDWRDNLIEIFRESAEVGGDVFHLSEIERIINGEPI